MINKIASTIEMSFDIPETEKKEAEEATKLFKEMSTSIDYAIKYLNIIYIPFKKVDSIPVEAIVEYRGAIYRFKEHVKKIFNKIKLLALKSILKLNYFSSDTHILELTSTFRNGIGDLEKKINILLKILSDYRSPEFHKTIVASIEDIKGESFELQKLVNERILDFIDANILAKDWMVVTKDQYKYKIEENVPFITQLFLQRQKALQGK